MGLMGFFSSIDPFGNSHIVQHATNSDDVRTLTPSVRKGPMHGQYVIVYSSHHFSDRNCADYDLCSDCEKHSSSCHDNDHAFVVVPHPCDVVNTEPLLRVSFY